MSKRGSNRSTTVEAKITKWFTKQARNEYQESTDKDSPEQGADGAKTIEAEITLPPPAQTTSNKAEVAPSPSSEPTSSVETESPSAKIKLFTLVKKTDP